jgi:hypothetical protein
MSKIHKKTGNICLICCEEMNGNGILLHKTRRQTHKLCEECGTAYISSVIEQATKNLRHNVRHKVNVINCPGSYHGELRNQCKKEIKITDLNVSHNSKLYTDIFRICYIMKNPNMYLCPNPECGEIIETNPCDYNKRTQCYSCSYVWCRNCQRSPFHEGKSCLEIEAEEKNTETGKLLWEKIGKGEVKFCPQCRSPTEKVKDEQGRFVACNKIICSQCRLKWCWLCSKPGIDYAHYNPENKTGCANRLWEGT